MLQNSGSLWSLKLYNSCKASSYILSLQPTAGLIQQLDTLVHILKIKYSPVYGLCDPVTWNACMNQFQSSSIQFLLCDLNVVTLLICTKEQSSSGATAQKINVMLQNSLTCRGQRSQSVESSLRWCVACSWNRQCGLSHPGRWFCILACINRGLMLSLRGLDEIDDTSAALMRMQHKGFRHQLDV